ncbi:DNA-3-methyladenine glycosylase [Anaeromicrobium sediminis]|uniref:Putative 3-methyladenine DNA glycosylase n=1 Tax=Anaeromicrobium sediminis TaxID=1478221 RepID=A0A267MK39_9FIRM|nr:DNA-3-methyladenine glycosylase [Anaeromicrobium sediminis]PAB59896.1 3-methyladenine DNA glycosylase [Anaeromicrobium sediminis]
MKLNKEFYTVDCIRLAKNLLGKILVRRLDDKLVKCKIVEVESYIGPEDKACHAYNNKKTNRTEAMFKEGGYAYIYLIYGMYNCLNIVSGIKDKPEAVLIRAVEPLNEIEILKKYRNIKSNKIEDLTNGPGKLCKALNIDRSLNKLDLVESDELYIEDSKEKFEIIESTRINIDYGEEYKDKLWRFYIKDNKYISKK